MTVRPSFLIILLLTPAFIAILSFFFRGAIPDSYLPLIAAISAVISATAVYFFFFKAALKIPPSILESIGESLVLTDANGLIMKANSAALQLLGYTEQELKGKPLGSLLEDPGAFEMLQGLLETGSVHEFELVYVSKHGRKIPVSCSGGVIKNEHGETEGFVCVAKDVTVQKHAEYALRESEERYRSLFENIPIGVYRMTPEGKIVNANPPLVRMLGYDSLEELSLKNFGQDIVDSTFPRDDFKKAIEETGEANGLEGVWKRKDGSLVQVREYTKVIWDDHRSPIFFEGTVEDISERKRIEQMKNEFISIVSHELRVPLTSIHGSLGWLTERVEELPERARKMIQIAARSSDRMVRLINDLLDIDKIESGKMTFYMRTLDLRVLVENAIEANQPYAEQYGVTLALDETAPDALVKADNDRLMQVLTNLLSNAAKFSPPNDMVLVSILRRDGMFRVAVTDHGPGIPEKFRSRIFQKFVQVRTSDPRQKGTGLGLNISKVIVEKLGGQIGFEIRPGIGTTFFFDLPEPSE